MMDAIVSSIVGSASFGVARSDMPVTFASELLRVRNIKDRLSMSRLRRHRQFADLLAHVLADLRREAVMKAGIDACIGNFVAVVLEPGPFARDARRAGAGQRKLPELVTDDVAKDRGDCR